MKKLLIIIVVILIGIICYFIATPILDEGTTNNLAEKLPESNKEDEVQKLFNSMTLEEKIAQMLIIDFQGRSITENELNLLKEIKPGGFILFGENFTTYNATLDLIKSIKATSDIPMFISVDEEGGRVSRLNNISDIQMAKIPPMFNIGATADKELAYEIGKIIGQRLNVFGINMDFAPILDIYSNPNNTVIGDRSFGTDATRVYAMASKVAKGLNEQNVISVYKHFPGHGDTTADSHYELPVVTKSLEELQNLELIPFQKAINDGAEVIMVAHLAMPNITSDNTPSSLSKEIITDLLKNKMGYHNLVITDSLKMKAITDNYSEKDIYKLAINAGVDILLMPQNPENAIALIKEMVENGEIDVEKINTSVMKILRLKSLRIKDNYNTYLGKEYLNLPEYEEVLNKIN